MVKTRKIRDLNVWMNGELVGRWSNFSKGIHEFRYYDSWLESVNARPLSLSLPLVSENILYKGAVVENYFDNLLPDSIEIRRRIQSRFSADSMEPFDLLAQIGRDCVGAVQLLPVGTEPEEIMKIVSEPMDEEQVAFILKSVTSAPFPGMRESKNFRISVAGAQEKTAFLLNNGKWSIPLGSTSTTHIFKLPIGKIMGADLSTSIENEWLCSKITKAFGIESAESEIGIFKDQKVLIVKRFDRAFSSDSKWIIRLPVEDMCQVTATSPFEKYETDGGPGIEEIMKILLGSKNSLKDRHAFFKTQILFWMLAAPDGHAKNFSIFLEKQGGYRLAPIYDVISVYPVMGKKSFEIAPEKLRMAMAVTGKNRHYDWMNIKKRHWDETALRCGVHNFVEEVITELVEKTPGVINEVSKILPPDFPETVSEKIFEGLEKAAKKLK